MSEQGSAARGRPGPHGPTRAHARNTATLCMAVTRRYTGESPEAAPVFVPQTVPVLHLIQTATARAVVVAFGPGGYCGPATTAWNRCSGSRRRGLTSTLEAPTG